MASATTGSSSETGMSVRKVFLIVAARACWSTLCAVMSSPEAVAGALEPPEDPVVEQAANDAASTNADSS